MSEPPLFTKSYDFVLWLFPETFKFPRTCRPALAGPLQTTAVRLLACISDAWYGADRAGSLRNATACLHTLRVLFRLAKDLHLMSPKAYLNGAARAEELGRMIGGWSKKPTQGAG